MTNKALVASHIPTSQIVDILTKPLLCNSNTIVWFKLGVYCIPFPNLERNDKKPKQKVETNYRQQYHCENLPFDYFL